MSDDWENEFEIDRSINYNKIKNNKKRRKNYG